MIKFVADGMLGSVTRWLRILGYDVKYSDNYTDNELLEITEKENRILLTKDSELFQRAKKHNLKILFIKGKNILEKIVEVADRYHIRLEIDPSISRCPTCGSQIRQIKKSELYGKIPEGTYKHYSRFWNCVNCNKVYWRGSHWKKINKCLEKAKKLLTKKN